MLRTMLKSKIHRATVTQADLHYVGSVSIDADLMDAADLLEGEQVTIVDIDNGARLVTYAITGVRGSGVIGINGAAAHLVHPGDLVILIAYGTMDDAEATGPGWCSSTPPIGRSIWAMTRRTSLTMRPSCCRPGLCANCAARNRRRQHPHRSWGLIGDDSERLTRSNVLNSSRAVRSNRPVRVLDER
ncbi:hypothetical protein BH09ACT7_BH09ACT7_59230 [soil metagenome]